MLGHFHGIFSPMVDPNSMRARRVKLIIIFFITMVGSEEVDNKLQLQLQYRASAEPSPAQK